LEWAATKDLKITKKIIEKISTGNNQQITSLVHYGAGAVSSPHCHPYGEEIFVLEGTFSDERGDFSTGSYIRNPPDSFHQPYSKYGCLIFIKNGYMNSRETSHLHVETYSENWKVDVSPVTDVINLYNKRDEKVDLVQFLPADLPSKQSFQAGIELFVLEGVLNCQDKFYPKNTWLRETGDSFQGFFSRSGCTVYRKTG